jgi:UrcA family protein
MQAGAARSYEETLTGGLQMDTLIPTRRRSLLIAALAAAACIAGTAQAQDGENTQPHQLKVRYSDLNVSTVTGATALYHRIQGAARFVCGEEGRSLVEKMQWHTCVRDAVEGAVSTVHSPVLSAIDAEAGGGRSMQTALLRR